LWIDNALLTLAIVGHGLLLILHRGLSLKL
jgi:hypothetical protein